LPSENEPWTKGRFRKTGEAERTQGAVGGRFQGRCERLGGFPLAPCAEDAIRK